MVAPYFVDSGKGGKGCQERASGEEPCQQVSRSFLGETGIVDVQVEFDHFDVEPFPMVDAIKQGAIRFGPPEWFSLFIDGRDSAQGNKHRGWSACSTGLLRDFLS